MHAHTPHTTYTYTHHTQYIHTHAHTTHTTYTHTHTHTHHTHTHTHHQQQQHMPSAITQLLSPREQSSHSSCHLLSSAPHLTRCLPPPSAARLLTSGHSQTPDKHRTAHAISFKPSYMSRNTVYKLHNMVNKLHNTVYKLYNTCCPQWQRTQLHAHTNQESLNFEISHDIRFPSMFNIAHCTRTGQSHPILRSPSVLTTHSATLAHETHRPCINTVVHTYHTSMCSRFLLHRRKGLNDNWNNYYSCCGSEAHLIQRGLHRPPTSTSMRDVSTRLHD